MIQYIEGLFVIRHWAPKQFKNLTIKKPSIFFGSRTALRLSKLKKGLRILIPFDLFCTLTGSYRPILFIYLIKTFK
ncbi:hypothetical protein DR864_11980 [Runella rosea]|uniref:Uncharacterized protein n=1 Tax=Runella rosea TaxID=2259595 RepID=A0A344TIE7_9BACT|nr:hypothetical protein DR864_11980 [Runella rosea]